MTLNNVRLLLLLWASLAKGRGEYLGYPRAAAFVQGRGYSKESEWSKEMQLIESALCWLAQDSRPDYRLLTSNYLHQSLPISALASENKLSVDRYKAKISSIEERLLEHLTTRIMIR